MMDNPYIILLDSEAFANLLDVLTDALTGEEQKKLGLYEALYLADEQHRCVDDGWPHYSKRGGDDE